MELKDFDASLDFALKLDNEDPLKQFRDEFYIPENTIYLDGNSLGLCSRSGEASLLRILNEWKTLGIKGWLDGESPWFYLAEQIGGIMASLVGAQPEEVVCTGTTTVNQHALLSTFYNPVGDKTKIVADEKNFPSDIYALKSHLKLRGYNPDEHLILVGSDSDGFIQENKIIESLTDETALVLLPSVFFRTGQLLDMSLIANEAHRKKIMVGFDCSHSIGVVPHNLSETGVDFAYWCGYKYLNGGPGCPAFLYLNERHFSKEPMMAGWFGYQKDRLFEMSLDFTHQKSAGGWQISTPSILSMAPLEKSVQMIMEAGMEQIRHKSLTLTAYLIVLINKYLSHKPYDFYVGTPTDSNRRGGHIALRRSADALNISEAIKQKGFICDFRGPDIIRIAPSPLYCRYQDVWNLVNELKEVINSGEHKKPPVESRPIS